MRNEAKAIEKIRLRYFARSPVSILRATKFIWAVVLVCFPQVAVVRLGLHWRRLKVVVLA
jgi:hypothetical protein